MLALALSGMLFIAAMAQGVEVLFVAFFTMVVISIGVTSDHRRRLQDVTGLFGFNVYRLIGCRQRLTRQPMSTFGWNFAISAKMGNTTRPNSLAGANYTVFTTFGAIRGSPFEVSGWVNLVRATVVRFGTFVGVTRSNSQGPAFMPSG